MIECIWGVVLIVIVTASAKGLSVRVDVGGTMHEYKPGQQIDFDSLADSATEFCARAGSKASHACGEEIAWEVLHGTARCWSRETSPLDPVCYIPLACASSERSGWTLSEESVEQLKAAGTYHILNDIWNYGNAKAIPKSEFASMVDSGIQERDATFVSTVAFGPAIYLRYTGLPVLSLTYLRDVYKLPPISRILRVAAPRRASEQDAWILSFEDLLMDMIPSLRVVYGSPDALVPPDTSAACSPLILHSSMNTGVRGVPLRWFPGYNAARTLRRFAYSHGNLSSAGASTMILQRAQNLQGHRAMRILEGVDAIKRILKDKSATVMMFENTSMWHQASAMKSCDLLVAPHGNGLSNIIFMKECSIVVELFPFKFGSPVFEHLAHQANLIYTRWEDPTPRLAPRCLLDNAEWMQLTTEECMHIMDCLECTRNTDKIVPDIHEIETLIRDAVAAQSACRLAYQPV